MRDSSKKSSVMAQGKAPGKGTTSLEAKQHILEQPEAWSSFYTVSLKNNCFPLFSSQLEKLQISLLL